MIPDSWTELDGPHSDLTVRVALDGFLPPTPTFARVVAAQWGDTDLGEIEGSVKVRGGILDVRLRGESADVAVQEFDIDLAQRLMNHPVDLQLANGVSVSADAGNCRSLSGTIGGSVELTLALTNWTCGKPAASVAWIGELHGGAFNAGNLAALDTTEDEPRMANELLHLRGHHTWNLVKIADRNIVVVAAATGASIDRDRLRDDFHPLEFVLGTPLRLDVLMGLDERRW